MVILLKATGRVSSVDQNPALFLLAPGKMGNYPLYFFFIFLKVLKPALYGFPPYFLLFLFEHLSEVVYYILICSELFFFLAWLGVITVFHFIFINLLHLFAFDLLLVLIVCVCVRKRAGMCACKEERILQLLLFSLPAVSRYTVQSWQQGSLLISDACTWAGMSQQHRQGAPSVPSALWLVTQCPGGRGQVLCEH